MRSRKKINPNRMNSQALADLTEPTGTESATDDDAGNMEYCNGLDGA